VETKELEAGLTTLELSEFLDSIPVGHRRQRFHSLAQGMLDAKRPICILETGCMRTSELDGPEADGCSTLVWDYVAQKTEGACITVDLDPSHVEYTKSKVSRFTQVFCADSLKFLTSIHLSRPIDFLYLDSMDFQGTAEERGLSALHHAAELSAVWGWLNHGALIAVDDCVGDYAGKHAIVKRFFDSIGVEPLVDDYIHVWRKPTPSPLEFPKMFVPSK
jgi:hypothetical protein